MNSRPSVQTDLMWLAGKSNVNLISCAMTRSPWCLLFAAVTKTGVGFVEVILRLILKHEINAWLNKTYHTPQSSKINKKEDLQLMPSDDFIMERTYFCLQMNNYCVVAAAAVVFKYFVVLLFPCHCHMAVYDRCEVRVSSVPDSLWLHSLRHIAASSGVVK